MSRRSVVAFGMAVTGGAAVVCRRTASPSAGSPPAFSVVPVVGDGRWIETDPPRQPLGCYDQRSFELAVGIEMEGRGEASEVLATTPVPMPHAEQAIDGVTIETEGCAAAVQPVGEAAAQLLVSAAAIGAGQVVRATARYRLSLTKQYFGHERDRFPRRQPRARSVIRDRYLRNSPGIETGSTQVARLLEAIRGPAVEHPWDLARRCWTWVRENIRPRIGPYTSVVQAIEQRVGDCEEMAGVFIALCRRADLPARLVWVPNHAWAEFHLVDEAGTGHWIPAHTACYPWFGWTGVHELVIQKGDRISPGHERPTQRLLEDWGRAVGRRPAFRWTAELRPVAETDGEDPGPGGRSKQASGEWTLAAHRSNRSMRQR